MARPVTVHLGMTAGALRAVVVLSAITVALTATTWYHGNTQAGRLAVSQHAQARIARTQARTVRELNATVARLQREVRSQCRFDGDLAGVAVTLNPATHQASQLGVKIVSDSRVAWHQAACPGRLAPPSPSFARWARFYHLPTG